MLVVRTPNILLLILLFINVSVNGDLSAPFDIRVDDHRVDTTRDLIVNTARPRFSWKISSSDRNVHQIGYQMQLNDEDHFFEWDSERVLSSQSIHVPYSCREDLRSSTYYRFRLRVWITNTTEASQWTRWIRFRTSIFNLHEYLTSNVNLLWIGSTQINMNELRKEFNVGNASPVKSAIVYMSGIGYYELYLNGNKVDPSRKLDPGWTTYEKRTLIVSYDVTSNITSGMNAVGVKLGNGWYSQEQQHEKWSYGPPRLLFTMNITFVNGDAMQVLSDETWRGREGSIKHDGVYAGEFYDSRSDRPGWSQAGFNDTLTPWIMAQPMKSPINETPMGILVLQEMPPIRAGPDALHLQVTLDIPQQSYLRKEDVGEIKGASLADGGILKPVSTWLSDSFLRTYDLGQNMVGWCRIQFRGRSGFLTSIRHAEILEPPLTSINAATRNIFIENLRNATATDMYVLHGDPEKEIYEPTFTIHGFRYLSIFGSVDPFGVDDVECPFVHSETTLVGHFSSSNPVINQIQHNIQWGQLSNLMSIPTDCPQRDERRGWMGDAGLSVDEALYNFDLIKFYENFLNLIVDMQLENGQVPDIVPGGIYPADPNWGTALPTITWQLYRHYQDPKILQTYYENVRLYIESLVSFYNQTGLVNMLCRYGDWLPPSPFPQTNHHLTSSFVFLRDIYQLINMSQVLNKTDDTRFYSTFYQKLTEEFHQTFFNTTSNVYADGLQSAQTLALALPGVVPTNLRHSILDYLANNIKLNDYHATTGIVSVAQLYPLLSDNGYHDLALQMISSISYPSYGFMFNNPFENATTLWELLNAPSTGTGSSRNHIMYGSVGAWFYSHLAGIDLSPHRITIRPRMTSEANKHLMNKLDCQLNTLHGLIHLSYTRHQNDTIDNSILLRLTVPPNTQVRLIFEPLFKDAQCHSLTENDRTIWTADPHEKLNSSFHVENDSKTGFISVDIGSGQYQFRTLWK